MDFDFEGKQANYNACVVGGGDILNEHYVRRAMDTACEKRFAISVSAGPQAPLDLLEQLDGVYVRDNRSAEHLKAHGICCTFMPDVSICLQPDRDAGVEFVKKKFAEEKLELYERKIGLVFNAHLMHAKNGLLARDFVTFLKAIQDIGKVMDETSASFILFPMSTQMPYDDRVPNAYLASHCKFWKKNMVVWDRLSVQETLNLISACDAVISTRLHSSIFSLISHTPFLDIVHHDKNLSFLKTTHLEGQSLPYWSFCFEELKAVLDAMLDNCTARSEKLQWTHQHLLDTLTREARNVRFVK
jgi:polysaccharide pyruvyl transferase WcaK-like protein